MSCGSKYVISRCGSSLSIEWDNWICPFAAKVKLPLGWLVIHLSLSRSISFISLHFVDFVHTNSQRLSNSGTRLTWAGVHRAFPLFVFHGKKQPGFALRWTMMNYANSKVAEPYHEHHFLSLFTSFLSVFPSFCFCFVSYLLFSEKDMEFLNFFYCIY